ncbi:LysR family transcriptional regulator [uncultured Amphritea sp.]|uniref:LysR family transcriptional regulator n=1 Tax=uncultured Amphritea sp. TaxID=981605 RepID=UPI00263975A2|nr:LysR family transcriptional regulator [uncultured Amphritea sp.]
MELRQLKYFEAVARTRNFSRAAEELHIAQPPLSRQIQNLEEELGVLLLDRSSRPMKLTNAGAFFFEQASQLLAKIDEVKAATAKLSSDKKLWMGVGFVPSILYSEIPGFIQNWRSTNEKSEISLFELLSPEQPEALLSGKIDVGLGRLAIDVEGITNIHLNEEKMILAVSSESPLVQQNSISMEEILNHTLILYPSTPRPSFADHVMRHFQVRGLTVRNTYETTGVQAAIGFAAAGMGVALVPESVVVLERRDVAYLPLTDESVTTPLLMFIRTNNDSPHVKEFIAYLRERINPAAQV